MRVVPVILISAAVGVLAGASVAYVEVASDRLANHLLVATPRNPLSLPTDGTLPRVHVEQSDYNFGTMQQGTKKSHRFEFKNVGAVPVTLRVGQPSCKCTVGEVTKEPIPPGGTGVVTLEWFARTGIGPFRQTAPVHIDPNGAIVELAVHGEVTDVKGVMPSELLFDKVIVGEEKSAQVYVMAMLQDDLTVSGAQLSDPMMRDKFDVKIEPVDRASLPDRLAKAGVRITLTARSDVPVGRFNQWLVVSTNLPDAEHLEIPVSGRVVGDISVHGTLWNEEQGLLMLGSVKSSAGREEPLNLVVRGENAGDIKFEVQSCDPPELKVTIGEPRRLGDTVYHVPLTIAVPPGTRPMIRTDTQQGDAGRVVLKTTHPKIKELALGVRFAVER